MDYTARLSPAEIETLRGDNLMEDAARAFDEATRGDEWYFEKSLRIKNTLDAYEAAVHQEPTWATLTVLLNCEYQLWRMYEDIPLRRNPYLSHWVEAIQRLDSLGSREKKFKLDFHHISADKIIAMRVVWIKTLLQGPDMKNYLDGTPAEVGHLQLDCGLDDPFELRRYIRMLEQEGIYEKTGEEEVDLSDGDDRTAALPLQKAEASAKSANFFKDFLKQNIVATLKRNPADAVRELTRLPIELDFLDFLSTLLSDHVLETYDVEPAPVITEFVQHALRTVEKMEKPPTPGRNESPVIADLELDYGKDAQTRAVQVLLLFIKNLIRKGLVGTEVLYFEIQEICVRYIWIKEVRDFKTWVEQGVDEGGT
jgi:hypothetical protein